MLSCDRRGILVFFTKVNSALIACAKFKTIESEFAGIGEKKGMILGEWSKKSKMRILTNSQTSSHQSPACT